MPFASAHLTNKKWVYYNELIKIIKSNHKNLEIAVAPGPNEIEEAKQFKTNVILHKGMPLNLVELISKISHELCRILLN